MAGKASAPPPNSLPTNTHGLASILSDIGASEFLPNFLEAEQDDSCIHSFRVAKSVEKAYGLPLELAATFVEKCRAVAACDPLPSNSLLDDLSGIHLHSPDVFFNAYIERANDIRHKPPHTHNRDYVNDTALAFPELGRTSTAVKQSQVILTFIEAMKVRGALLHSSPNSKSITPTPVF